jgi:hypothetical protein
MADQANVQPTGMKKCTAHYRGCALAGGAQPDSSSSLQYKAKAEMFRFFANLYAIDMLFISLPITTKFV